MRKVGDIVTIRSDLNGHSWNSNSDMARYAGKQAVILKVLPTVTTGAGEDDKREYYKLDIDRSYWSWFEVHLSILTPDKFYEEVMTHDDKDLY